MESSQAIEPEGVTVSPETSKRQAALMRDLATTLQAIPLPAEHGVDAEKYVAMFGTVAKQYEEALPRIQAAGQRLDQAMKAVDADDLPPPPEGETVAGGIMIQMMSVPAVKEAWTELMRASQAAAQGIDGVEAERLGKVLGLDQCEEPDDAEERLSASELAQCGTRGAPVSLQKLVDVFRANDISLEIQEDTCSISEKARVEGARPDATNAGPSGLSQTDEMELKEGFILCSVEDESFGDELLVNKWDTDTETSLTVLNIRCTIYPHSASAEADQIARVKKAMEAVAAVG